jgi:hypothetical protein
MNLIKLINNYSNDRLVNKFVFTFAITKIKYSNVGIYVQLVAKFDNVSKIA